MSRTPEGTTRGGPGRPHDGPIRGISRYSLPRRGGRAAFFPFLLVRHYPNPAAAAGRGLGNFPPAYDAGALVRLRHAAPVVGWGAAAAGVGPAWAGPAGGRLDW